MPESCHELLPECAAEFSANKVGIKNIEKAVEHLTVNCVPTIYAKIDTMTALVNGRIDLLTTSVTDKLEKVSTRPSWLMTALLAAFLSLVTGLIVKVGIK